MLVEPPITPEKPQTTPDPTPTPKAPKPAPETVPVPLQYGDYLLDERMADVDGDGAEERLELTANWLEGNFCMSPLLKVYREDQPIIIQPLFERMGFVRPYFGETVDFNGDARMDFHVMYEARSFAEEKGFPLLTVQGNTAVPLPGGRLSLGVLRSGDG